MTTKTQKFTTPLGTAVYPALKRPDTKFHDLGQYKADVSIPIETAKPLMDKLSAFFKEQTGTAPNQTENTMFKVEVGEDGNPKGTVLFKLRIKNRMTKQGEVWDRRPKMFGADLTPAPAADPRGGSKIKVSFEFYVWEANGKKGVSLQPVAVKIIELVSGEAADGADFGFDKEDGYVPEGTEGFVDETELDDDGDDSNGDF